ncbi:DUF3955 domain-containing protein [Lapidilactobacillus wuchangensis]|uniref:DUF3955 domain-containing protein n=1 Tax=Lapidilactobacillus wuchangensis TaxID=2486001 RepID=UPI002989B1FC|nr:DUF3955 domain-containing protein [Lapidilactobacillus wuchangensis]
MTKLIEVIFMDFGNQIKQLRTTHQLTQADLATRLHVSRQTISSWETNRNLPDLPMVVLIAQTFQLSLDQLILGDVTMKQKLMRDGSQIRRARLRIISLSLLILGGLCFLASALIGSHLDSQGFLHEPFFLLPIGYLLLFAGVIGGLINLVKAIWQHFRTSL